MKIIQLVPVLGYGDAVSNEILALDQMLKEHSYESYIYAPVIDSRLTNRCRPFHELEPLQQAKDGQEPIRQDDIVIYHMATASDLFEFVGKLSCIRVLWYHNITPPAFFEPYSAAIVKACADGLKQVKKMYQSVDYALADSEFNKQDLLSYGYSCPIDVMPILIPMEDYRTTPDPGMLEKLSDGRTNIMFLGRIVPNKKWEDVVHCFALYQKYWNANSRLLMVGNYDSEDAYYQKLKAFVRDSGARDVIFTGHIRFPEILACYQKADLFLCMSEHEGFCVPIVESMIFQTPVVAYASCAVPDTMGEGTCLVHKKKYLEIAGLMDYILTHEGFRDELLQRQQKQLERFSYETISRQFLDFIETIHHQ